MAGRNLIKWVFENGSKWKEALAKQKHINSCHHSCILTICITAKFIYISLSHSILSRLETNRCIDMCSNSSSSSIIIICTIEKNFSSVSKCERTERKKARRTVSGEKKNKLNVSEYVSTFRPRANWVEKFNLSIRVASEHK